MWSFSTSEEVDNINDTLSEISPMENGNEMPTIETDVDIDALEDINEDDKVINGTGFVLGQTFEPVKGGHIGLVETLNTNYFGGKIQGGALKGGNIESAVLNKINGGLEILKNNQSNLQNQIKQSLENLLALKEFIKSGYEKIINLGFECDNEMLTDRLKSVENIHKAVMEENDRQISILSNLLKITVEPTSKSISELINKHKNFTKIQDLLADYDYGTAEASDRLALAFSGITQTKLLKDKIKKALDKIKMSEDEFKKTESLTDLRKTLFKKLKDLSSKKIEGEEVNDLFSAISILEGNLNNKYVFDKKTTFGGMMQAAADNLGEIYVSGGVSRPATKSKSSLQKRVQRKQKTTYEIIKSFIKDVNLRFNEIKQSVDVVSIHIGDTISYDDNIKNFISTYSLLSELTTDDIYFSLLEFDEKSSDYKNKKAAYLDQLNLIISTLEPLIKGTDGSYFKNIKQNIISLIEVIDIYTNVFKGFKSTKVTGGAPVCPSKKDKTLYKDEISNSIYNIKETADKMVFYGKIASIRENIKCTSIEHEKNQKNYAELLGKALGEELTKIEKTYGETIKKINEDTNKNDNVKQDEKDLAKLRRDAHKGLFQAIEAIDLYLVNFTDAISKNLSAVNELEKMLQSTQIISMWFVNKSGENFNNLFKTQYNTNKDVFDKTKKAIESISVLKNILSMFITIGNKFGSVNLKDKLNLGANEIYKRLVKYIWVSAVDDKKLRKLDNIENNEYNNYFIMCIKSIIAKILTVVGTYSIFKNPDTRINMITNPVRLILGGNNETPIINDNAIELYIRLPLLVEFYKKIFNDGNKEFKDGTWNDKTNETNKTPDTDMIAYIPEIGSLWSGLIKIIFDKSPYLDKGIYTTQNIKDIISEINKIYKHYSSHGKEKVVREAFCGLINEINRRYGIMKRCDVNEYYQTLKKQKIITIDDAQIQTNFDILGEGADRNNPGPSALYTEKYLKNIDNKTNPVNPTDLQLVQELRKKITDNLIQYPNITNISTYSFEQRIKYYKEELKRTTTNDAKFNLVMKAIEKSENTSINDIDMYIIFHEIIIAPINVLYKIYEICNRFIVSMYERNNQNEYTYITVNNTNFLKIIEKIFIFTSNLDGLVSLKFVSNKKFLIIYNNLQDMVESSITNIKYMISKFRNIIDIKTIEKIDKDINNLEDKFLNHMLKNDKTEEEDITNYNKKLTFDSLTEFFNKLLLNTDKLTAEFDKELYKYIMWSDAGIMGNIHNNNNVLDDVFKQYDYKQKTWKNINVNHLSDHYNLNNFQINLGIVAAFNQILFHYLNEFYDKSTKKIYIKLFNKLASEIYEQGINNMTKTSNALPLNNIVLTGELIFAIKTLLNRSLNPQLQNKYHALLQISDVSPHMLEKYRAELPVFIKLFNLLIQKCNLFKNLLENNLINSDINIVTPEMANNGVQRVVLSGEQGIQRPLMGEPEPQGLAAVDDNNNPINIYIDFDSTEQTPEQRINNYKQILNNIINGCSSLIDDAQTVLDELKSMDGKSNLYFELKNNFIKDYYKITKELPFMPLSSSLYILHSKSYDELLPIQNIQTDKFKFMYGTTSIFNSKESSSLNTMPYMKELLNTYNNSMQIGNQIDTNKFNDLIKNTMSLLSFYNDIKYKSIISINNKYFINQDAAPAAPAAPAAQNEEAAAQNEEAAVQAAQRRVTEAQTRFNEAQVLAAQAAQRRVTEAQTRFNEAQILAAQAAQNAQNADQNDQAAAIEAANRLLVAAEEAELQLVAAIQAAEEANVQATPTFDIYIKTYAQDTKNSLNNIINLTENTFVSNNKNNFYNKIKTNILQNKDAYKLPEEDRNTAIILNIIDMNIVPINIHSLMREIPLINIYNYSLTYNEMIETEFKLLNKNTDPISNFKNSLINPYKNDLNFNELIEPINELNLSKPRFLSDQLKLTNDNNTIDNNKFNTKIIRDTIFLVNIQRYIRYKIRNDITEIKSKVVNDYKVMSEQITEYDGKHEKYDDTEFVFKWK